MSEEPLSSDSPSEKPAAKKAARRISNPRPKKTAKEAAKGKSTVEAPVEASGPVSAGSVAPVVVPVVAERAATPHVEERQESVSSERVEREEHRSEESRGLEEGGHRNSWPEPETIQGGEGSSSSKRKRRRKKKGGQLGQSGQPVQQGQGVAHHGESHAPRPPQGGLQPVSSSADSASVQRISSPPPQAPRIPIDTEDLAKKAWKIFLGEVGEEGLALIGDQDARELSRRSFRLAEIFLEEQGRRVR